MTWLIRHILDLGPWLNLDSEEVNEALLSSPPLLAVNAFMPSERDKSWISVFEVADGDEALVVAGAIAFRQEKIEQKVQFVAADRNAIAAATEVRQIPGTLNHAPADQLHREIHVPDVQILTAVCGAFINGERFYFEVKEACRAAERAARDNQIDCKTIAKNQQFSRNWGGKNILRFIGDGVLNALGVSQAT